MLTDLLYPKPPLYTPRGKGTPGGGLWKWETHSHPNLLKSFLFEPS